VSNFQRCAILFIIVCRNRLKIGIETKNGIISNVSKPFDHQGDWLNDCPIDEKYSSTVVRPVSLSAETVPSVMV
jgi:hypothetical protein